MQASYFNYKKRNVTSTLNLNELGKVGEIVNKNV
jgi:hypothetical protein